MIRPLRQRHRHLVIALGIFLPVAFVLGIAARRSIPTTSQPSSAFGTATPTFERAVWQRDGLFAKSAIQVRLWREPSNSGRFAVSFAAQTGFLKPDLLVYWSAGNTKVTSTLPDQAILLGAFGSSPLLLPEVARKSEGRIVLFSLADHEIVEVSSPFQVNEIAR